MKFYTACALKGNKVLVRGYNNGVRFTDTVTYKPSLYMRTDTPSKYKTLTGVNVGRIKFENLYEAREFLDQYRELEDCPIYGNTDFITQYIMETYPSEVEYDLSKIKVAYLDLECETEGGFPNLDAPNERINLVTIRISGVNYVITMKPLNLPDCRVVLVASEKELIKKIFDILRQCDADILTEFIQL